MGIVAVVVVSVLILTSQTYAEVPVLILTFLAAMLINKGTDFLLGEISFVSNSVTGHPPACAVAGLCGNFVQPL